MMPMDWTWLVVTLAQALGASLALATLGFAYDRVTREGTSLLAALVQGKYPGWLAVGAALLAAGMAFSGASWLQKGSAIGLALCLGWLAWSEPRSKNEGR